MTVVEWRPLAKDDLPAVQAMMGRVLAADGGLPQAASEEFLRSRLGSGIVAVAGGAVVATAGYTVDRGGLGAVDPDWRGRGLGSHLLDWMSEASGQSGDLLTVSTESLTDDADALFQRRGLRQTFGEDVMRIDLSTGAPGTQVPDATLTLWADGLQRRFFACYEAAFGDRPGFPGWTQDQWVHWISDGLVPQWTVLATRDGEDVGFVASGAEDEDAWIVQVGVVPGARGQGIGAGLTAEALRRMRSDARMSALLDVNVNNPGAARVYERLGFVRVGRRARYAR